MILRRVRVVPRQQPRAGDVGVNSEVSGRQGFHCGEVVPGEWLGWASGGGPARPADHLDFHHLRNTLMGYHTDFVVVEN